MNRTYYSDYRSLPKSAGCLGLLLLAMSPGNTRGQTVEDFSAAPPFSHSAGNIPAGGGSTVAAVDPSGVGALYQAFYHESYTDEVTGKTISWGGVLHAIFMDESGRFREDNGVKGKLEDTGTDYVVDIFSDESVTPARPRFRRFQQTGSGKSATLNPVGGVAEMEALNTIWNARDNLASIAQADLEVQRSLDLSSGSYGEDAGTKRFVFTYLDVPGQTSTGEVDPVEVIDFVPELFNPDVNTNWRYLGLADQDEAMKLVKYVRGQDIAGWRTRDINLPGDDSDAERYWILGDIINSSPLVVNPPDERYDLVYGDSTYKKFKEQYAHRRQMIYAGANDGMLHAFNGGVWDHGSGSFQTQGYIDVNTSAPGQPHKLGAEMWAYVPMNLQPHLQWLKAGDYPHVYYVDGASQAFDVNIFADDATHPGGWGTILVTGMRLGGGDFALDLDADAIFETTRTSAVIVMDITDPEKPPVLLAELTSPELNFTTGAPALVKARRPDSAGNYAAPARNSWLLILGSGPDDLATATSTVQKPALLAWDLQTRKYVNLAANLQAPESEPPGFYGSFASVDQNNDYVDDALYVGTVEGTEQAPAGRLKRIVLNASAPALGLADGSARLSTVVDVARPIVARPGFIRSYAKDENWLLFGTGRSYTFNDYRAASEQGLFGVKEPEDFDNTAYELSSLVDSSDILVQGDVLSGSQYVWDAQVGNDLIIDDARLATFADLFEFMDNRNGWHKRLRTGQNYSERVITNPLFLRSSAIFASFLPDPASSENKGESFIYALNYRTGTADEAGFLGMTTDGVLPGDVSAGVNELTEPALNYVHGNDPKPDQVAPSQASDEADSKVSVMAGTSEGGQEQLDFNMPPSALRRLSWELLETPF